MDVPELTPRAIPEIAALVRRAVIDPPTADELSRALVTTSETVVVHGDSRTGVVATVLAGDQAFIRLLAVDPTVRRAGRGRALVERSVAVARAAGARTLTVGADAPGYLWPGVDTRAIDAVALFERLKFTRVETNFHMDLDLHTLPPDPGGWRVADGDDRDPVAGWAGTHWPWWHAELMRALDQDGLVITTDADGIAAVCAHDVNRAGLVGPVAVRPDLLGRGVGVTSLLGALHRMRDAGRTAVEISWVGPVVPYARLGATIGRTFFVYRQELT